MIRLLPKIEQALENHLQNQFRMAIRREFDRGAIKVSDSKTRGGKIGGVAHAIFEEARKAMKLLSRVSSNQSTVSKGKAVTQRRKSRLTSGFSAPGWSRSHWATRQSGAHLPRFCR